MKLHANARLSLKGRELLVDRIENAGWSLTEAAEAAGVSDRTARKWLARYRAEGEAGCWIAPRRRSPSRIARTSGGRGDRRAAAAADDRRGDRRVPGDGALDRLGDPDPDRDGQARPARARARSALRARAARAS